MKGKKKVKRIKVGKIYTISFIISILTIVLCLSTLLIEYFIKQPVKIKETEKIIEDREITDGVEMVYDSVVTVENYLAGEIFSSGTGFVYKKDDEKIYIITNYHVITSANESYVVFPNNSRYKTKIVGYDEQHDIAVLSIPLEDNIKEVKIGSSENMRLGDTVFVIGTPINQKLYSFTVTKGIISGKDRLIEYSIKTGQEYNDTIYIKVLQTDAAINAGNSGGPLCDRNGNVIGVINLKINSDYIEGIGFAIPIEDVVESADRIINNEPMIRPYIPFNVEDVLEHNKLCIKIRSMKKEGYELQEGDCISKVNDEEITSASYLKYIINKHNVGDKITITYLRDKKINIENGYKIEKKEYKTEITLESK